MSDSVGQDRGRKGRAIVRNERRQNIKIRKRVKVNARGNVESPREVAFITGEENN